jgi:hypothetical protein
MQSRVRRLFWAFFGISFIFARTQAGIIRAMNAPSDPQVDSLRVPPHSIEAEQSVIGGLLRDNAAFDRIADMMQRKTSIATTTASSSSKSSR